MREIYLEMTEALHQGERFVVATVVATKGSTPRKPGAKMLFFKGGRIVGTIGGGCGEAEVWKEAMGLIGGSEPKIVTVDLTEDVEADDRICGGTMETLLEQLEAKA